MEFKTSQNIILYKSKYITNDKCAVLDYSALNSLKIGDIVRICMRVSKHSHIQPKITLDSPYVKILQIEDEHIFSEITNICRYSPDFYYPLRTGEKIWIKFCNIFEISTDEEYLTNMYVKYTGPIDSVVSDSESDKDSYADSSDSEDEHDLDDN